MSDGNVETTAPLLNGGALLIFIKNIHQSVNIR